MVPLTQFYNLTFSSQKKLVRSLKNLLGFTPGNITVYQLAFRHSSISGEIKMNNERLEFLGDAVLSAVVAEYVFKKFPYKSEGFLTEMRSKMVSRPSLNSIAKKIGLGDFIQFNKADKHINQMSILGNAFESLIGAIYLDKGFNKTKIFIYNKIIQPHFDIEELESTERNFKSRLLERAQKEGKSVEFKLVEERKENYRKLFSIVVVIDGENLGMGVDFNKKNAEQKAAEKTLMQLSKIFTAEEPS